MADAKADDKDEKFKKELAKFVDESDEHFTGSCMLQILDQDGYTRKVKGSCIESPVHLSKADGMVFLEAEFPADPLFYLALNNEEGFYLFAQWWLGPGGWSKTNQICSAIPKDTQALHTAIEKDGSGNFTVDAEVPFLRNGPGRLVKVDFATQEKRYITKVTRARVAIPEASWAEFKQYRSNLWQSWKAWGGKDENEKKKPKKDEDATKAAKAA